MLVLTQFEETDFQVRYNAMQLLEIVSGNGHLTAIQVTLPGTEERQKRQKRDSERHNERQKVPDKETQRQRDASANEEAEDTELLTTPFL